MFPFWRGSRDRLAKDLDRVAATLQFRIAVATLLAAMHLFLFALAGRSRLDLPFNSAPGQAPYFSDPDAPDLGGYPRQPHHWSRLVVSRWDSEHYIGFALRGLTSCPDKPTADETMTDYAYMQCGLGWFPAYGMIAGTISSPFDLPVDVVLVFLSVFAAIVANLLWTSKTFVDRIGRPEAYMTLIAFNLFPSAFYLVTPYTESATLALVLGGFIALTRKRYVVSALLVGASTGLRAGAASFGVGLGAALLMAAWQACKRGDPKWWRPIAAAPLCGWGLIAQFVALQIAVGDWSAYFRARDMFGDERDWSRIFDPVFYLKGFTAQHMDSVMLVGGIALVALGGRAVVKRFAAPEAMFIVVASIVGAVLGMVAPHDYWGLNRYLLVCPIIFLSAGMIARRHTAVFVLWLLVCMFIYWHVELCSYVAHGRSDICPCLGRMEWWAPIAS
jgi:hypothetical protein